MYHTYTHHCFHLDGMEAYIINSANIVENAAVYCGDDYDFDTEMCNSCADHNWCDRM